MSFSQDIRSSGNFQELFGKLKRRFNKSEISKDDLATLQRHVNNMRTQIDWANVSHITDNIDNIPIGPHDFIFEPDTTEVMLYQPFANILGDGTVLNKTLNGIDYDVIEIGDSTFIKSAVSTGTYHYQPYATFKAGTVYTDIGLVLGGDYIEVPHTASLSLSQFSIACWFRTTKDYTYDDAGYMVSKGRFDLEGAGDNINYALLVSADNGPGTENVLECLFETSAGVNNFALGTTHGAVNDGQWHLGVGTYDGVTLRVYVDGVEAGTFATTSTPDTGTRNLFIGQHSSGFTTHEGDMDQVYVWNNDLTAGEVSALYSAGTIPQTSAIVYSNDFGGTTNTTAFKKCYYAVPTGASNWDWNVGFHPPSMNNENSISLNVGSNTGQFVYYDEFGTDLDFLTQNFSHGFWIYPTDLSNSGSMRVVAYNRIDGSNKWDILIDNTDNKLWMEVRSGGVGTKRQYDTPLTVNNWYYINTTWEFGGPTLSLKVNDNADTTCTKTDDVTSTGTSDKLYFGSYGNAGSARDFKGYLAFPIHYKHTTVLTTAERTSLYNYNTKTNTTVPFLWGLGQYG